MLMSLGAWNGRAGCMSWAAAPDAPRSALGHVVRVLNHGSQNPAWTVERLRRTVKRLVTEGMIEPTLLSRARRQRSDDWLVRLVGIKAAAPARTLQQIASQLRACANAPLAAARVGIRPRSNTC